MLLNRDSGALVITRLKENRVIKFLSLLLLLPGLAPYLHNGRWNRVISNKRKAKFALYKQRSPIHQSHISQIALTKRTISELTVLLITGSEIIILKLQWNFLADPVSSLHAGQGFRRTPFGWQCTGLYTGYVTNWNCFSLSRLYITPTAFSGRK